MKRPGTAAEFVVEQKRKLCPVMPNSSGEYEHCHADDCSLYIKEQSGYGHCGLIAAPVEVRFDVEVQDDEPCDNDSDSDGSQDKTEAQGTLDQPGYEQASRQQGIKTQFLDMLHRFIDRFSRR